MKDMVSKGRGRSGGPRGETHGGHKLTERDVIAIRQVYRTGCMTQRLLGREYGVDPSIISEVVNYKLWKHVR